MKLNEIDRTSTSTWSPSSSLPLIATGIVAGALDKSFSHGSSFLPPATPPTIIDLFKRAEAADPSSRIEIDLDVETFNWLSEHYDTISERCVGRLEFSCDKAIIRLPTFVHEGVPRVIIDSFNDRQDRKDFELNRTRLSLNSGGYKLPAMEIRFARKEEKTEERIVKRREDAKKRKEEKKKNDDDDDDDDDDDALEDGLVRRKSLITFEVAFMETLKDLRTDLIRTCLGAESIGLFAIGFKVNASTSVTKITVLVYRCYVGKHLPGPVWETGEVYAGKEDKNGTIVWQLLGEDDPKHFTIFRYFPKCSKISNFYYECAFEGEWSLDPKNHSTGDDIIIPLLVDNDPVQNREPLIISAPVLWEAMEDSFDQYCVEKERIIGEDRSEETIPRIPISEMRRSSRQKSA
ncbi:hypothetical protein EDD18DRAFT_1200347 [Armillaria luteobubalina]|uniref:Uncharacterized protein n=1 Tax=Armillaria luteobubalina TaxID=153913 RepID=A0AA39PFL5_9AGAR|nr:hypothetical protein EDD18DRAFT_1200347 [Armillaria luteobubalina]